MPPGKTTRVGGGVPTPQDVTPELFVVAGDCAGRSVPLIGESLVLGKSTDADLSITDTGVSRQHAKLSVGAGLEVTVFDLGSTNGTFVNDTRVTVAVVQPGDRIRLGPVATIELRHRPRGRARLRPEDVGLSHRQFEVARLVGQGLTNAAVGERLQISPATVKSHLDQIYLRLELGSRTALALWLAQRGLLESERP